MRWTYVSLWPFADVLSSPPSAALPLNSSGTEKCVRSVFVSSLGFASSSGPPHGGTYLIIPDLVAALVFLRLQSREGTEGIWGCVTKGRQALPDHALLCWLYWGHRDGMT